MSNYRSLITKIFTRKYQFALHPDAVALIEEIIDENEIEQDGVQDALEQMAAEYQRQESM